MKKHHYICLLILFSPLFRWANGCESYISTDKGNDHPVNGVLAKEIGIGGLKPSYLGAPESEISK
jgi:hypothetical protein